MSRHQVDLHKLEDFAPEILEKCEHLLSWFESSGKGDLPETEDLRQVIQLLQEAGVDTLYLDEPTDEEIADILETAAETENDEAQGTVITDEVAWQAVAQMIANHQSKPRRASA
jgi:hypothetical protein